MRGSAAQAVLWFQTLMSKNVNPKVVQEMLGHATISQTMDSYSYVLVGMQAEAAAALQSA